MAGAALGQEPPHDHQTHRLGTVDFPNSGTPAAQEAFLRGIALLHSFEYTDAADAFREAQAADPGFALAFWGEALTHTQLLWGVDDADGARVVLARLAPTAEQRLARAGTARERAYGAAVEVFFADADVSTRARAFADSLRSLAAREPEDLEAAAFAAIAIQMAASEGAYPAQAREAAQEEAIALATRVFAANPDHPGAAHYLIHAYDDPRLAPRGLEAARAYARIAPDAEHALHMPSHIFLQVGEWKETSESNERAWAASRAWVERRGASPTELDFHALQWLQYAYLQQGRFRDAARTIATAREVLHGVDLGEATYPDAAHAVGRLEFALAAESGDWRDWRPSEPAPVDSTASARARGFARIAAYQAAAGRALQGDPAAADRLAAELRQSAAAGGSSRVPAFYAAQLEALAASARGDAEALSALERAAQAEEALSPIGPPSYLLTHELLGAVLLETGRPLEAVGAYQRALERRPNRSTALLGLARARTAAGDRAGAADVWRRLLENWREGDPDRPEIREARDGAVSGEAGRKPAGGS